MGNEKTLKDSEALLHKVKKIKPKCLDDMPKIYIWRKGPEQGDPDHQPLRARPEPVPGRNTRPVHQADEPGAAEHLSTAPAATPSRSPSSAAGPRFNIAGTAVPGRPGAEDKPAHHRRRRRREAGQCAGQGRRDQAARPARLRLPRPDLEPGDDRRVQCAQRSRPPCSSASSLLRLAVALIQPDTRRSTKAGDRHDDRPGRRPHRRRTAQAPMSRLSDRPRIRLRRNGILRSLPKGPIEGRAVTLGPRSGPFVVLTRRAFLR